MYALSVTLIPGVYPIPGIEAPGFCCSGFEDLFGATTETFIPGPLIADPVVITDISTPEPSSVILLLTMLLGAGFVARKRVARAPQTNS